MKKISKEELLRGVAEAIGFEEIWKKMESGKKLRIKHGIDPTAPDLHLGYAVNYRVMRRFQDLGHTVILLIGDFTGRIGDPTEKSKTRPMLSKETVEKNLKSCIKQIGKVLNAKKLEIRRNSEWYEKMTLEEFLNIAKHITVPRLWERDFYQERLRKEETVYAHELLYPILQGYDSVMLKSDLTVNGTDQIFNELAGREFQEIYGQEPQAILALPVLPGTDGKEKMSQSLGNYIGLAESPDNQYGKVMSISDELIITYFKLLTDIPLAKIEDFEEKMKSGKTNPRDIKMRLALEIVSNLHSNPKAKKAEERFKEVFQEKRPPEEMSVISIDKKKLEKGEIDILDIMLKASLVKSRSEARRVIKEGGLEIDGERITDIKKVLPKKNNFTLKKGKIHFIKIKLE